MSADAKNRNQTSASDLAILSARIDKISTRFEKQLAQAVAGHNAELADLRSRMAALESLVKGMGRDVTPQPKA